MSAEALARIDTALCPHTKAQRVMSAHASVWAMSTAEILAIIDALAVARAEIVRLSALIPEPPTDAEPCNICGWTGPRTQYLGIERLPVAHPDGDHPADWLRAIRHRGPITDNSSSHAGTEYALEVGHDRDTEGVYLAEAFEEMATPAELLPYVPGARLVERQWSVTDWTPVPADELDDDDAEAAR